MKNKYPKIGIISSRGGHLFQVNQLKAWWEQYPRFWVTAPGGDTSYFLKKEKIYIGNFPEQKNLINAVKNFVLAMKIISREKPDILFSDGAGIAPPFFLIGKIFGCKLIYMETYDFISFPTLTGKILQHFVDLFLVQHQSQKKFFKNSKYWGPTL
ncbi:UDP-N-acetylglucosamine--LPS N-acetylglucosamine transferase [Patescibacteria group bacterium]|nr:UDP-N-acetylglucosamine--LPS N-acetylglucosamine transferase [Patescibacteria group bacterium]